MARFIRSHMDADVVKRLLFRDADVEHAFMELRRANPSWIKHHLKESWAYARRLNRAARFRKDLERVPVPAGCINPNADIEADGLDYWLRDASERPTEDELISQLLAYDVISFDVFDTLLVRKVDRPNDLFRILAQSRKFFSFHNVRKEFEWRCRRLALAKTGSHEITFDDIYKTLDAALGFDEKAKQHEVELEQLLCVASVPMQRVFNAIVAAGKTVVLTSDMYLPRKILEDLLHQCGYEGWSDIYLSNEHACQKGDGALFDILAADFVGKRIVHVGDNKIADVKQARAHGLDAIWWPDMRRSTRGLGVQNDCLAASFYRALIHRKMVLPQHEENLLFKHGYRVGGILAFGFCQWIDELAKREGCDRILFSARDCEVLYKLYKKHFDNCDARYLQISRSAIMQVATGPYTYSYLHRKLLVWANMHAKTKPLSTIFTEAGFDYLVPELEKHDIEPSMFPCLLRQDQLEEFVYSCCDLVREHAAQNIAAAKAYFADMLAGAKKVLVVDVGWGGTCAQAFAHFVREHMPEMHVEVVSALMCSNRSETAIGSLEQENVFVYAGDTQHNRDLLEHMTPDAKTCSATELELHHMPLEYLFTSKDASLVSYELDKSGDPFFVRMPYAPANTVEIDEIQRGILSFADDWRQSTYGLDFDPRIFSYTAIGPLIAALKQPAYCCAVYGRFTYDMTTVPGAAFLGHPFAQLYPPKVREEAKHLLENSQSSFL